MPHFSRRHLFHQILCIKYRCPGCVTLNYATRATRLSPSALQYYYLCTSSWQLFRGMHFGIAELFPLAVLYVCYFFNIVIV